MLDALFEKFAESIRNRLREMREAIAEEIEVANPPAAELSAHDCRDDLKALGD